MELTKEYNFIWYGQCDETECTDYDLTSGDSKIEQVWQINDAGAAKVWDSTATSGNEFDSLVCGHAYYVRLDQAYTTGSGVNIAHAVVSDFAETDHVHAGDTYLLSTCEDDGPSAPTTQQASIDINGQTTATINVTAVQRDDTSTYTTKSLNATGATFEDITEVNTNNITYKLEGNTLSYKITDSSDVLDSESFDVTINANANDNFAFGANANQLVITFDANVTALPKPTISLNIVVDTSKTDDSAVKVTPTFANTDNNWNATSWQYKIYKPNGEQIGSTISVDNFDEIAISIGDTFLQAGNYTISADILDDSSIIPGTSITNQAIDISQSVATLNVSDFVIGNIDRDGELIYYQNISGSKLDGETPVITGSDPNVTIAVEARPDPSQGNRVKVTLSESSPTYTVNNVYTIKASGTKWYAVLNSSDEITNENLEITTTFRVSANVGDSLVFSIENSTMNDNSRDTDDTTIPERENSIAHDNISGWTVAVTNEGGANVIPVNWEFKGPGDDSNYGTVDNLNKSGLTHDNGNFAFKAKYNTTEASTEKIILTFTGTPTESSQSSSLSPITTTLNGEVTQAIKVASFTGCDETGGFPSITVDIDDSTSNTAVCTFDLENCSVNDVASTEHGVFTYSITSGVLTYSITDIGSEMATTTKDLTITANADENSEFAGNTSTKDVTFTLSGKVNSAEVLPDKLWVNFGFADATKQIASDWYELEQVSEVITKVDFDNGSYSLMAAAVDGAKIPERWVNASGQDYATANSAEDEPLTPQQIIDMADDSETMVFDHATMTAFGQFPIGSATLTALGLTANDLTGLPILSDDGGTTLYVNKPVQLDYTKFQIASSDSAYATDLQSWLDTNSVSSIRGLMMTTSPTRPTTLTTSLATKAFNDAELLNLHCNVTECGPKTTSSDDLNFRLIADVKTAGSVTSQEGKYTFNCSATNYTGSGKPWEDAYAVLTNASSGQIDKSDDSESAGIVITDMYFIAGSFGAIASETKVKLSTLC